MEISFMTNDCGTLFVSRFRGTLN